MKSPMDGEREWFPAKAPGTGDGVGGFVIPADSRSRRSLIEFRQLILVRRKAIRLVCYAFG